MPFASKPRLQDPAAERWHAAMARKSKITADVNYRRLRAFCGQMEVSPSGIVTVAERQTEVRDLLGRFVDEEVAKRRATWYIHSSVIAVKSWLKYNDRPLKLAIELPLNAVSERREDERVPTVDELSSAILAAKPHERAVVVLMAHAGLRPGAIGAYEGDDGLRLKDLLDLHYAGDACRERDAELYNQLHVEGRAIFGGVPARIRVRSAMSKARHQYLTFLGEEGVSYISSYLEQRMAKGERLSPSSAVAAPRYAEKAFVRSLNISARIRRVFRAAGISDDGGRTPRPYVLRQYFLNRCLEAQARAGVPDRFVEHWAGHRGDITAKYYTTGLPRLPESLVEEMRAAYRKCEPYLSTRPTESSHSNSNREAYRVLLSPYFTDAEIAKIDLNDVVAVVEAVRTGAARNASKANPRQQVIPEADLSKYLADGWLARMAVSGSKFVIERPV